MAFMATGSLLDHLTRSRAARIAIRATPGAAVRSGIKIFPDKPVTRKPAETRMGSSKGSPVLGFRGQAGRVMFEIAGGR